MKRFLLPIFISFSLVTAFSTIHLFLPDLDRRFFNDYDIYVFEKRAIFLEEGVKLYRDVFCEYPPLGCAYMGIPRLFIVLGLVGKYREGFILFNWFIAFLFYLFLAIVSIRRGSIIVPRWPNIWFLCLPAFIYMLPTYHDFPTSVITCAGIYLYIFKRLEIPGCILLGLGASMKGYPIFMLPALAVGSGCIKYQFERKGGIGKIARIVFHALRGALITISVFLATHIPIAISSGMEACLVPYVHQKGLGNLESLQFVIYVLFNKMPSAEIMRALALIIIIFLLIWMIWINEKRGISANEIIRFSVASLLIFVLSQPGVSPHYNFWWEIPLLFVPLKWKEFLLVGIINLCYQLIWPFFSLYLAPFFPKHPGIHMVLVIISNISMIILSYSLIKGSGHWR